MRKPAVDSPCLVSVVRLIVLLVFSSFAATAFCQEAAFSVAISSPAASFTVGSPIRLDITIVNHSEQLFMFVASGCGPRQAGIIALDYNQNVLLPRARLQERHGPRLCNIGGGLGPNEKTWESINLAEWFDLSRAGRYSLQLNKSGNGSAAGPVVRHSNVLEIEIVKPKFR